MQKNIITISSSDESPRKKKIPERSAPTILISDDNSPEKRYDFKLRESLCNFNNPNRNKNAERKLSFSTDGIKEENTNKEDTRRTYHLNDKRLPIYEILPSHGEMSKGEQERAMEQTFKVLHKRSVPKNLICSLPPRSVQSNLSFVIDTTKLSHVNDLFSDTSGSWRNYGQRKYYYCQNEDGQIEKLPRGVDLNIEKLVATLHRLYYENKDCKEFRRIISFVTDADSMRLPLTKVDYQFEGAPEPFQITPHGNSKYSKQKYVRTQFSTLDNLKHKVKEVAPRLAVEEISEKNGGIYKSYSSSVTPKNLTQAYNLSKKQKVSAVSNKNQDSLTSLILECKFQEKTPKHQLIQKVISAPERTVVMFNERQMRDLEKFCTNEMLFSILQVDATFDLGDFSVTTTTYEHLLLHHQRSRKHPSLVGPMLIHDRKTKETYKLLFSTLKDKCPSLKNLKAYGTDGETNLHQALSTEFPEALHLRCFLHFKNNVREKLKKIGIDESGTKIVIADIFGIQSGTIFEEGILDSDDSDEYDVRLESLRSIWLLKFGEKGDEIYKYLLERSEDIKQTMLKSVRRLAGLGNPPRSFSTNKVEAINNLLKMETDRLKHDAGEFAEKVLQLVNRQSHDIEWAVIGKGPYRLHPRIRELHNFGDERFGEEAFFNMTDEQRKVFTEKVLSTDVVNVIETEIEHEETMPYGETEQEEGNCNKENTLVQVSNSACNTSQNPIPFNKDPNPLDILASCALEQDTNTQNVRQPSHINENSQLLSVPLPNVKIHLSNLPNSTIEGIYQKAARLVANQQTAITIAPGFEPSARMVASTRLRDRPHLVTKGRANGEFKCDRSCPHHNALKICSHTVATAEVNQQLPAFLAWFQKKNPAIDLNKGVRTDMPSQPGAKKNQRRTGKRSKLPPVDSTVKRVYPSSNQNEIARKQIARPFNPNPFFVKEVTKRMIVCQGCRGPLKTPHGTIPEPPFNFCIARQEKGIYRDAVTGEEKLSTKYSDAHYHLDFGCVRSVCDNFNPNFLVKPDNIPTEVSDYISNLK